MSDKNKKPTISSLLDRPHFNGNESGAIPPDPAIPTRILATLDDVVAFKDNPRQSRNPLYDEIKESIRNRGLDHAPNVTRKNPADPYMIKDGGNTRLEILRELWEETGDEKFYRLDLMFHPWKNQLDMLIGHAVENELRGGMLFIERALHAKKIKSEIEESENISLSTNAFAKRLTAEGWSMDHSNLGQMLYAEEILFPVIPEAFWSGIGIDRVKKIRKLLEACRTYWEAVSTPEEGDFDSVWNSVFTKLDGEGFDVAAAEYQLCGEMAQRMDGPVMSVTAQIQGLLEGIKGIELIRPSRFEPPVKPPVVTPTQPRKLIDNNKTDSGSSELNLQQKTLETAAVNSVQPLVNDTPEMPQPEYGPVDRSWADEPLKYALTEIPGGTPVQYQRLINHSTASLQSRAYEIAFNYAQRFGLEKNIYSTEGRTDLHIGFWVSSDGLAQMSLDTRIHWVFLCQYAFIRSEGQAHLLLENMARALGGDVDVLQVVHLLMSVNNARAQLLGGCIRGDNTFLHEVWEEVTELEAIAGIVSTRSWEESQRVDEVPDQSFVGL